MFELNGEMIVNGINKKINENFLNVCFAVYVKKSPLVNPEHIGSAFLIKYCGICFLVTAAHVVKDPIIEKYNFFIVNNEGLSIQLNRSKLIDCFLFNLSHDLAIFSLNRSFNYKSKLIDISHNFEFKKDRKIATLIGFPRSKNKRPLNAKAKVTALHHTDFIDLVSSNEIHMNYSNDESKTMRDMIHPSGMSGGCAFSFDIENEILNNFSGESIFYEGMLIEKSKNSDKLILVPFEKITNFAKVLVFKLRHRDFYKYQADWYMNQTINCSYNF